MSKLPVREGRKPLSPKTEAVLAIIQALFPIVASLATAIWVVNQYLDQQKTTNLTRLLEARKPFYEKQFKTYGEVAEIVGQLVTLPPDTEEWKKAKRQFESFYWAGMSMVEDGTVETAMARFSKVLGVYERIPPYKGELNFRSYCLAHKMRASIEASWSIDLQAAKKEKIFGSGTSTDPVDILDPCDVPPDISKSE